MTPPVETPDTADHAAEPQADLWTSDSERGETPSEPLPSGATDPTPDLEPPQSPADEPPAPDGSATERDAKGQFKPRKGKARTDPQARVEQATAKEAAAKEEARIAREEAARYKAELDAVRRPREEMRAPAGPFPGFNKWAESRPDASYEDYIDARAEFVFQRQHAAVAQQQQVQTRIDRYNAGLREKFPNFTPQPLPVSPAMAEAVLGSDYGPEITHWLDTHPDQCAQLAEESKADDPVVAALWMRKYLEAHVTAGAAARPDSASAVRPSAAKPPVSRVGGTASATPVDPEDLEFGPDYIRQENAREKKRQEASRW